MTTTGLYLLELGLLAALGVFGLYIPDRISKKKRKKYLDELKVGDKVTTLHGITGTITEVGSESLILRSEPDNIRFEVVKWGLKYK